MSEFYISSGSFKEGEEIPKHCGYKHGNIAPYIAVGNYPSYDRLTEGVAIIMDDPDAMGAVGKVWVHWLMYRRRDTEDPNLFDPDKLIKMGKNDFGEIGYGGPAPPDKRHTYIFKVYALDTELDLKEGFSKQELEEAMQGHIIAEAKLTGTFAP